MARVAPIVVAVLALAVAACGGQDQAEQEGSGEASSAPETATTEPARSGEEAAAGRPRGAEGLRIPAGRARIVADESPYGLVLFDANGQVVYAFENDRRNRSRCTSAECVKAWPPVLTRQPPSAGAGVDAGLLGTIRRGDGMLQVTYNGRPLYFYEHEAPGEIKCHNVNLHGGLWWVVTPQGDTAE